MYGVARQRRTQPAFAELLDRWLESVATSFHDRILPFDEAASRRWGLLHAELGYTNSDLQIAAIALHRSLTVVTRNVRDFAPTGVTVLNPFEEADDCLDFPRRCWEELEAMLREHVPDAEV